MIVTHNMQQAARVSDHTAFFWLGKLIEVRPDRPDVHRPAGKADRRLRDREIRLMDRSVRHFEEELGTLQTRLLEMGGLAEERVRASVAGLVARDVAMTERVLRGDEPINQLHVEIDERCFRLLALYQPMATDLRGIVAAVKINSDLERVGDLAVNIAEAARRYAMHPPVKQLIDIPRMGDIAQEMLHDALDSFVAARHRRWPDRC